MDQRDRDQKGVGKEVREEINGRALLKNKYK